MKLMRQTGIPAKLAFGFEGGGEARERAQFLPKAESLSSELCFDDVRTICE